MNLSLSAIASFLLFLLAACSFGLRYDLADATPSLDLDSSVRIVVEVKDRRPEVLSGRRPAQWIGAQLRGPTEAEQVVTASGRPVAQDLADAVVESLRATGIQSKVDRAMELRLASRSRKEEKLLRITLHGLQSESFVNVSLIYDLQAEVVGPEGRTLSESRVSGEELIGGEIVYPLGHGGELIPPALGRRLKELLEAPALQSALK